VEGLGCDYGNVLIREKIKTERRIFNYFPTCNG